MDSNKSKYILAHIKKYENDLEKLYEILLFLKYGIEPKNEIGEKHRSLTIHHIEYTCFLITCFLDIATSLRGIENHKSYWERLYYIRNGYLSINESIKTYHKNQKEIAHIIDETYPQLKSEFKVLNLKLKTFKRDNDYQSKIIPVRNKAGGHYDKDFNEYYKSIKSIEGKDSVKTIEDFVNFLMNVFDFWYKITDVLEEESQNHPNIYSVI